MTKNEFSFRAERGQISDRQQSQNQKAKNKLSKPKNCCIAEIKK